MLAPARRATAGVVFVAVMYTGGLAIAMVTDSNGRGDSTPNAPVERPQPAVIADNSGRSPDAVPSAVVVTRPTSESVTVTLDNGRGGPDPAFGPFAVSSP